MNTTLDIAATITSVLWPIVVLIILIVYRKRIPLLIDNLVNRISKVEVVGISLDLAKAESITPEWVPGGMDLRRTAQAIQVNDSTASSFITQLKSVGKADYAEVNLGAGEEWLTSRLFILSIILAQTKELESFIFLESFDRIRKRYIGWAEPERIRWALARHFPWLEQAYASVYSDIIEQDRFVISSNKGRLGFAYDPSDPGPIIDLLNQFIGRIQAPPALPPGSVELEDWVIIDPHSQTYEHAKWIDGGDLEEILGDDLHRSIINSSFLRHAQSSEQLSVFLAIPDRFIAVVDDDKRFEYLVDRKILMDQVLNNLSIQISK